MSFRIAVASIVLCVFVFALHAQESAVSSLHGWNATIDVRAKAIVDAALTDAEPRDHPKYSSYEYLARAAKIGCLNSRDFDRLLSDLNESTWVSQDPASRIELVFALPPITRYVLQFSHCLTTDDERRLKKVLELPRLLLDHGTINHWSMRASSIFLLSEKYPDLMWSDSSSGRQLSAPNLVSEIKPLLTSRFLKFFRDGNAEQFSPVYQSINFFTALNLIDFATDQDVKALAFASATVMLASLRANSFHGQLVPPLTRAIVPQRSGLSTERPESRVGIQFLLWFYFGQPLVTPSDLKDRTEPLYPIMYALSSWRPPSELLGLSKDAAMDYEIRTVTPSFSKWAMPTYKAVHGSAYIADDFAIGVGNSKFNPGDYNASNALFGILLKSSGAANTIECYHPYWLSNAGENAWQSDRSSPFQEQWTNGRQAVIVAAIPQVDPWRQYLSSGWGKFRNEHAQDLIKTLQCRIPVEGIEITRSSDSIFLDAGNVYVGIRVLTPNWQIQDVAGQPYMKSFRVLKVSSARTALYFEVRKSNEVDWRSFQSQFKSRKLSFDEALASVDLEGEQGKEIKITYRLAAGDEGAVNSRPSVEVDGKVTKASADNYWLDAPFLKIGAGVFLLETTYGTLKIEEIGERLVTTHSACPSGCVLRKN
ncbi:hypothetical protein IVB11_17765 [Bradyrhizobium sp. 177]|uniref:hypothetical protein n=1 Tax=Bradyrhizobium sp. 177 TaxID=2782647 RepID=UPI001FF984D9|nr:hypothetical protein [Bradyrhizobium sp. 177]MCK1550852.1 hypothetical protein [Bradyrhizobium sp. 177]